MQTRRIGWADQNYDMALDEGPVLIEEQLGNRGLGFIVTIMVVPVLVLGISLTIWQMATGRATGNPVGLIIFIVLTLGWPTWWGIKQFVYRRFFSIDNGIVHFEYRGLTGRRKIDVNLSEYGRLVYGRKASSSRAEGGVGQTGYYFVDIRHPKKKYSISFYQCVPEQMSDERILRYSEWLGLPVEDITPKASAQSKVFREKAQAFVEARQREAAGRKSKSS